MALTRSLIVYNGSDSTPATDFTDRTDWQQTELASMANLGEAAAGQWLMRDEGGTLPDFKSPEELADAHNVAIARVGSNILFRGRIAADDHFRGRQKAGRAKEITLTLEDQNSHLRGIVVHEWVRPAETDVARALALVSAYLNGSPRATTVLGTSLIITGSNTISLPAKTYSGVTPFEIMQELAANGDKETFVSIDNELALFGHDYTGYASLLRISDDLADANSTTYAPWEPRGSQFGRQRLSALRTYYGTDVIQNTTRVTNSNASQFDYWEDVFWDSESTTDTQAAARAQKMLDYRATADVSYSCAIGPMSGDEIWKIKPGQTIQYKSRASRGGRNPNGTYTGDSFLTTRIRELRWTTPAEDQYTAHLELERPKRLSPPSTGNQALAIMPPGGVFGGTYDSCYGFSGGFINGLDINGASGTTWYGERIGQTGSGTFTRHAGALTTLLSEWLWDTTQTPDADYEYRDYFSYHVPGGRLARLKGTLKAVPDTAGGPGCAIHWQLYKASYGTATPTWDADGTLVAEGWLAAGGSTPIDMTWPIVGDYTQFYFVDASLNGADANRTGGCAFISWACAPRGAALNACTPDHPQSGLWLLGDSTLSLCVYTSSPSMGQLVAPFVVGVGDGSTVDFYTAPYAYEPGSLRVTVDGIDQTGALFETDPTIGQFTLSFAPLITEQVIASFKMGLVTP